MKIKKYLATATLAGSALLFGAGAQAQLIDPSLSQSSFQLAQLTTSPGSSTATTPTNTLPEGQDGVNTGTPGNSGTTGFTPVAPETTTNQPTITNNITVPNTAPANTTPNTQTRVVAPPPQTSTTQVEVRNEAPANTAPIPAPNIDIDMPDMPDVNVGVPAGGSASGNDTVTQRTERIILNDSDDDDAVNNHSILYMAIFGVLAIFLIAVIAMAASRRHAATTIEIDDRF